MGLFRKNKKLEAGLTHLHNLLHHSFKNVQKDTSSIFQWLDYLYQKNIQQENLIKQLQKDLTYYPKSKEEIRKIVDEFYSYEHILNRIKELDNRIEELRKSHHSNMQELQKSHQELHKTTSEIHKKYHQLHPKIDALKSEISIKKYPIQPPPHPHIAELKQRLEKLESKKASIKEKLIKRITKNSKDYIKSIILSYIKKYGKITALQLKEMVVEEQGLCSKSSFYRLLEEIEEDPDIGVIKKGKEKHYIKKNFALQNSLK